MSDDYEMPPLEGSGSLARDGGAAPAVSEGGSTSDLPPVQQPVQTGFGHYAEQAGYKPYADELVKPQAAPSKAKREPTLSIDKTQGLVFVSVEANGLYTEFVLEDVIALSQHGDEVSVMLRDGHGLDFECSKSNAETLFEAWKSRRTAKRNA